MPKRQLSIAGQRPTVKWKRNRGRKKRTIDEAVAIARQHGVRIPNDVMIAEADKGDLPGHWKDFLAGGEMVTARGPRVTERPDGYVYWDDHYNRATAKIPFRVHPEVLTSDEGIVAVLLHEMVELEMLREVFALSRKRRMNATDYGLQVSPGVKANFHDRAWDAADAAVMRMREGKQ